MAAALPGPDRFNTCCNLSGCNRIVENGVAEMITTPLRTGDCFDSHLDARANRALLDASTAPDLASRRQENNGWQQEFLLASGDINRYIRRFNWAASLSRPAPSIRGHSSVGRALAWHARGQGFDSPWLHHICLRDAARQPIARVPVQGFAFHLHHIYLRDAARQRIAGPVAFPVIMRRRGLRKGRALKTATIIVSAAV